MKRTAPPVRPFAPMTIPGETVEVLSNGLTFHRFSGGDQPVCRLSLFFEGGQSELGNDFAGRLALASLAEGSTGYPTEDMADRLDFNGVRVGSSAHGHYSSLSLAMLCDKMPAVLPIVTDMLRSPLYPEERLATAALREKARIESLCHEVAAIADESFGWQIMGEKHPLAHCVTDSDIESLSRDAVLNIHRRMMCPSRAHAFFSGLLDDRLVADVRAFLESLPSSGAEPYGCEILPFTAAAPGTVVECDSPETMQCAIVTGMPAIGRDDADYIPLRLAVMALGGYFGSRLMTNIREEKGLTYGISAALIGSHEGSFVKIAAQCDRSYADIVTGEIAAELRRLVSEPPAGDELRRLKLFAMTSLAETLDSPTAVMSYHSSRLLVGIPEGYFEAQQRAISELTPDTVAEMAARYLDPGRLITSIAGK